MVLLKARKLPVTVVLPDSWSIDICDMGPNGFKIWVSRLNQTTEDYKVNTLQIPHSNLLVHVKKRIKEGHVGQPIEGEIEETESAN